MTGPTVGEVMAAVRNYFPKENYDGSWTISGGKLSPEMELMEGDWIAVSGSRRNDGVYHLGSGLSMEGSTDETFTGRVWLLAPPPAFLTLCSQISAWCGTHERETLASERFGSYSMSRMTDAFGLPVGWQQTFAAELTPWRRMYTGVKLG